MHKNIVVALLCVFAGVSCTAQKPIQIQSLTLGENHVLLLLDSAEASRTLVHDATDRFFELVTASEMSIQMKKPLEPGQTRADLLPAFTDYLRRDVAAFTPDESVFAAGVMQEVFNTCQTVAPGIFPDTLILIKTKGNHYGNSVYYTRENTIVIPADALASGLRDAFKSTMYHELFHVYSRLNPEKRTRLYRLIGFEHIGLEKLKLPDSLALRVLYNPDGVDFAQKITLDMGNGTSIDAAPIIFSKNLGFKPGKRAFFSYVDFSLYQIVQNEQGRWEVKTKPDGYSSTLNMRELPDFFRQIKDNTGYIIHPDEVLADNFSFLMSSKTDESVTAKFSEDGKKLILDVEAVLKN
ncbi:MAG: hypothetical protein JNJ90_21190 [Saprospiraceae bacterium]|jgi:hypothetical protein|nr:hypothetical protein [Saprospiraceae bacterium]